MALPNLLKALLAIAVVMATLTMGVVVANAVTNNTSTTTTYYACLSKGKLSKVATAAPKCKAPASSVSWNSVGPPGPAGTSVLSGVGAPATTMGAVGDFYIDSSTYTIYGPATQICDPNCEVIWGAGTSLKGQGFAYDTQLATPSWPDQCSIPTGQDGSGC